MSNENDSSSSSPSGPPATLPVGTTVDPMDGKPTAATDDVEPEVVVEPAPGEVIGFEDLGLSEDALKTVRDAGYLVPTPIQEKAIPDILEGRDVIGSAQTGTGKTATFTLPICDHIAGRGGTLAVVLAPTREIAQQTADAFEVFGKPRGIRSCVLIGGVDMKPQLEALKTYPQVIVATPGRLYDHMERGTIWLEYVEILVLDEADRMLDMGFLPQINRIANEIPSDTRQTLLFSATMPPPIEKLCRTMMHDPVRVSVGKPMAAATTIDHSLWICEPGKKMSALRRVLRDEPGTVIVFSRSKKGAVELWQSLHSAEFYDVTMLHSDRTQEQRMQALSDFKGGKARVLIATDVAARGLDIANVALVVNFDMPFVPEDYVHRIGRSGRAQAKGRAVTLFTRLDKKLLHDIEKMLGKPIPVTRDMTSGSSGGPSGPAPSRGGRGPGSGERRDRASQDSSPRADGAPHVVPQGAPRDSAPGAGGHPSGENGPRRRRRRGGRGRGGGGGPRPLGEGGQPQNVDHARPEQSANAGGGEPSGPGGPLAGGAPGEGEPKRRRRRRGGRGRRRGPGGGGEPNSGGAPGGSGGAPTSGGAPSS